LSHPAIQPAQVRQVAPGLEESHLPPARAAGAGRGAGTGAAQSGAPGGPQGGLKMTGARFMAGFYGTTSHGGLILIVMF